LIAFDDREQKRNSSSMRHSRIHVATATKIAEELAWQSWSKENPTKEKRCPLRLQTSRRLPSAPAGVVNKFRSVLAQIGSVNHSRGDDPSTWAALHAGSTSAPHPTIEVLIESQ
jgi:hypothetical protein